MPNRPELGRQLQPVLSTDHGTQNMLSELKDLLPGKNHSRPAAEYLAFKADLLGHKT